MEVAPNAKMSQLGEYALIEHALSLVDREKHSPLALGDDCVTLRITPTLHMVLSTDMLVAETDVVQDMTMEQVGAKAATINISDLASKGVQPQGLLLALGIHPTQTFREVDGLLTGFRNTCQTHRARFLGGDINEACDLIAAATAFGTASPKQLMPRSGAKPGDIVAVTGMFGYTGLAFALMGRTRRLPPNIPEIAKEKVLNPKPRLMEGKLLARTGNVSAAIDSSDGLARSLYELSKASKCGFRITHVPLDRGLDRLAARRGLSPLDIAFYGGEEFELVVTIKKDRVKKTCQALQKAGADLIPIGVAEKGRNVTFVDSKGDERRIEHRGWQHFKHQ